jgi:hypothetical protein
MIRSDLKVHRELQQVNSLVAAVRGSLPPPLLLYVTVALNQQSPSVDVKSISQHADMLVLQAYDECEDATEASANSPISLVQSGVAAFKQLGVHPKSMAVALPWFGYDFPCTGVSSDTGVCKVAVPRSAAGAASFSWRGWVTRTSASFAAARPAGQPWRNSTAVVRDASTVSLHYDYLDSTNRRHQVWHN